MRHLTGSCQIKSSCHSYRFEEVIYVPTNYVRIAIDRIGGPTKASTALAVSNTTIHDWIKRQRVLNIDKAKLLAELSGMSLQQIRCTQ